MAHLENVPVDDLREALETVEGKRSAQRLMVAIAYKQGVSQTDLASWYGLERKTVYNWLTRLDSRPGDLVAAARDRSRPGRTPALADEDRERLLESLRQSPDVAGYDAPAWTPELVRRHVRATYDTDYSLDSCRRLLREAGLAYRTPGELGTSGDELEQFCAEFTASRGGWMRPGRSPNLTEKNE